MCRPSRILVFNCSHEMALAANVRQYFPPKNVQQMEGNLCLLPLWWADDGDAVIVDDVAEAEDFLASFGEMCPRVVLTTWNESYESLCRRTGREFVPTPWGWNVSVRERFRRMGVDSALLPSDEALQTLRTLASREFAIEYFSEFVSALPSHVHETLLPSLITDPPLFCRSLDIDIPDGVRQLIFKSPWSSSGRGVFVANVPLTVQTQARLKGFLQTQGGFLVDRFYDKVMDFALEYDVQEDGNVEFIGFSVFDAGEEGRYGGNVVAEQQCLSALLEDALGKVRAECGVIVNSLVEHHKCVLSRMLGGRYCGVAGVDMLLVRSVAGILVHPCIEINLRMNMGVLAMRVYERLSASGVSVAESETALTQERKCGFVAKCVCGRLIITKS